MEDQPSLVACCCSACNAGAWHEEPDGDACLKFDSTASRTNRYDLAPFFFPGVADLLVETTRSRLGEIKSAETCSADERCRLGLRKTSGAQWKIGFHWYGQEADMEALSIPCPGIER
uniref:Uncharacterized protein n=1 Tax=Anopheles merus TaxID=30066 RepID=A0A182VKE5_ANOME